jgi:hypothetical protein
MSDASYPATRVDGDALLARVRVLESDEPTRI